MVVVLIVPTITVFLVLMFSWKIVYPILSIMLALLVVALLVTANNTTNLSLVSALLFIPMILFATMNVLILKNVAKTPPVNMFLNNVK